MATTIVTKYGSDAPAASDLVRGELAVDTENGRLYTENSSGAVVEIGLNPEGNVDVTGTVTADGLTVDGAAIIKSAGVNNTPADLSLWHTDVSIVSGDDLAVISAEGSDSGGSAPYQGAKILFEAAANWDTGSSNYYPTNINFFTQDNSGTDTIAAGPRMVISSAGNVGIGTSSPSELLHVSGASSPAIRVTATNTPVSVSMQADDATGFVSTVTNHPLVFRTNNAERMRIDSAGRLGISNSSAVNYTGSGSNSLVLGNASSATGSHGMTIVAGNQATSSIAFSDHAGDGGTTDYRGLFQYVHADDSLRVFTASGERFRIMSGGDARFTLGADAVGSFQDDVGEVGSGTFCLQVANSAQSALKPLGFRAEDIRFATSGGERMRITSAGEVTKPYQPAFSATVNAAQNNLAIETDVTIVWGAETFDVGSNFASNTFTAPVTGKYQLNLLLRLNNIDTAANYYIISFFSSNNNYRFIYDPGGGSGDLNYWATSLSVLADMDASDTVYITVNQGSGTAQTDVDLGNTYSRFSGYLVA